MFSICLKTQNKQNFIFFSSIEVEAVYFNGQIAIKLFFFLNKFQLEHVFLYSL